MFGRKKSYSRSEWLEQASRAQAKGKTKKAAALYQELLAAEPEDTDVHRKAAPVLASAKLYDEGWKSFRVAARALVDAGFLDKAVGVYREATHYMPRQVEIWLAIADVEAERGRPRDAAMVLIEGRRHFRSRKQRPEAIQLLSRVRKLDPSQFEAGLDLARLWRKTGNRNAARRLLAEMCFRARDRHRVRRIRATELRLSPTPAALYRWLRAILIGR